MARYTKLQQHSERPMSHYCISSVGEKFALGKFPTTPSVAVDIIRNQHYSLEGECEFRFVTAEVVDVSEEELYILETECLGLRLYHGQLWGISERNSLRAETEIRDGFKPTEADVHLWIADGLRIKGLQPSSSIELISHEKGRAILQIFDKGQLQILVDLSCSDEQRAVSSFWLTRFSQFNNVLHGAAFVPNDLYKKLLQSLKDSAFDIEMVQIL